MTTLIEANYLFKTFTHTSAVNGVSLTVAAGEIYGLVGPDGAGKTTTLRLLCGALRPDSSPDKVTSIINIAGIDLIRHTEQARAKIGYLPQRFSLYEDLTVIENIRFFAEVRGLSATDWRPRCMEILEFVGLAEFVHRRAEHLSGGMRQKLGLAAALVHRPVVLLLDEPTTGVDPETRQDFWQLVIRLVAPYEGGEPDRAVLVTTPYMDEAARCTRVGFMQSGRLLVEGPPQVLRQSLNGRILEMQGKPLPLLLRLAKADEEVEDAQMFGDRLHLRVRAGKSKQVTNRLNRRISQEGGEVLRFRVIPPKLEDVFISMLETQV